jgi:hypothetical protein
MLRRCSLILVLGGALLTAGCGIDWEREGPVQDEVRHYLAEEFGVKRAEVECIKREAMGAEYECRAETATASYECEVARSVIHKKTTSLECHEHVHEHEPQTESDD